MQRSLVAELLDSLPADDAAAVHSRRDLRVLNVVMGQTLIMRRLFRRHAAAPPRKILEIGAGDGTFMLRIARAMAWPGVSLTLLDQQDLLTDATRDAFRSIGWNVETVVGDVFDVMDGTERTDIVSANLFLHHFTEPQLGRLFGLAARVAPLLVACEPRRNAFALLGSRLVWALGCNGVTRHDALASVRAGFAGRELSALWPQAPGWRLTERSAFPFTHSFVARHAG